MDFSICDKSVFQNTVTYADFAVRTQMETAVECIYRDDRFL